MSTPIIAIKHEGYAHLLANYLTSQQIPASVQAAQSDNGFVILLENANQVEDARAICDAFTKQPNHPRYQQAAWQRGEQVNLAPRKSNLSVGNLLNWAKQAPFTALVLFTCTLVFALSYLGFFQVIEQELMMQPLAELTETHEYWRLLGPAFIHFSALHFIFNLLWWSMIGGQIERTLGGTMLLLVFVVSAVASNVAQVMVSGPAFGGLSGVVYAVLGFVWWLGWLKPNWGLSLPNSIIGFMLVWLVLGYADVLWVSMANTAHTVGLVSGCLLALVLAVGSGNKKPV